MTKAPDKKTPANGIAVERLPMDAICGLHPAIEQLFDKLSIPPFRIAPKRLIDKRDLMRLLDVFPLLVAHHDDSKIYCTGSMRLYLLANAILGPSAKINCVMEAPQGEGKLSRRVLAEILYAPACMGGHSKDAAMAVAVARRAIAAGQSDLDEKKAELMLAELYGVDRRQFKQQKSVKTAPGAEEAKLPDPAFEGAEVREEIGAGDRAP